MLEEERRRVLWCGAAGLAVGLVLAVLTAWELALLFGWIAGTAVLLVWTWWSITPLDGARTAQVATAQDNTRNGARLLLVAASVASLVAVAAALHHASQVHGAEKVTVITAAMAAIATSWLTVQTVYTLRYAHLYYTAPVGGIDFPETADPSYVDFAYVAFSVGMTFQVSDTALQRTAIRGTVLRHALLSYVFGVAIIAATINVVASFVG